MLTHCPSLSLGDRGKDLPSNEDPGQGALLPSGWVGGMQPQAGSHDRETLQGWGTGVRAKKIPEPGPRSPVVVWFPNLLCDGDANPAFRSLSPL